MSVSKIDAILQRGPSASVELSKHFNSIVPDGVYVYNNIDRTIRKGDGRNSFLELNTLLDIRAVERAKEEQDRTDALYTFNFTIGNKDAIPFVSEDAKLKIDNGKYREDTLLTYNMLSDTLSTFRTPTIHISAFVDKLGDAINYDYNQANQYYGKVSDRANKLPMLGEKGVVDPWLLPVELPTTHLINPTIGDAAFDYLTDGLYVDNETTIKVLSNSNDCNTSTEFTISVDSNEVTDFVYGFKYHLKSNVQLKSRNNDLNDLVSRIIFVG